ncbi:TetR/AcrR family transcriptional regulator [Paenibacillus albidus]|nr:TetR/AcrR family transcriptional regulator [Paenibacillus albidus]
MVYAISIGFLWYIFCYTSYIPKCSGGIQIATKRLPFNRLGYEGTKMAQIAEEAGIRKQSIAYYYPTKKELLLELLFCTRSVSGVSRNAQGGADSRVCQT